MWTYILNMQQNDPTPGRNATSDSTLALRPQDPPRSAEEIAEDKKTASAMSKLTGIGMTAGAIAPFTIFLMDNPFVGMMLGCVGIGGALVSQIVSLPARQRLYNDKHKAKITAPKPPGPAPALANGELESYKKAAADIFDQALANGQIYKDASFLFSPPGQPQKKLLLRITEIAVYQENPASSEQTERITARLYEAKDGGELANSAPLAIDPLTRTRPHIFSLPLPTLGPSPQPQDPAMDRLMRDAEREQSRRPPAPPQGPTDAPSP